jgi:hypothetical protein
MIWHFHDFGKWEDVKLGEKAKVVPSFLCYTRSTNAHPTAPMRRLQPRPDAVFRMIRNFLFLRRHMKACRELQRITDERRNSFESALSPTQGRDAPHNAGDIGGGGGEAKGQPQGPLRQREGL